MIRAIQSPIAGWTKTEDGKGFMTGEGYRLDEPVLRRICQYNRVPADLIKVDQKHGTNLTQQVLELVMGNKVPTVTVDDVKGQILSTIDPRRSWVPDEIFIDMDLDRMILNAGIDAGSQENNSGAMRKKTYTFISNDDDPEYQFMGDVFKKQLIIERQAEGGLLVTFGLLRQICTNGSMTNERAFRKQFKSVEIGGADVQNWIQLLGQKVLELPLSGYLHEMWTDNHGEMLKASVQDYLGMKNTLKKVTDENVADLLFPVSPIEEHYGNQGIDIYKLTRSQRDTIPSGVTYYDSFNFLTNGIKAKGDDIELGEKIEVASWTKPSRLDKLRNSSVAYKGMPHFSPEQIHRLAGDKF